MKCRGKCISQEAGRAAGFTLIELLVVIAIIALLAAILFPVFGRARENARRSACQSNLKQIGLGIHQYVQDFDEKLPLEKINQANDYSVLASDYSNVNVFALIQPYVKNWQVFRCPSATNNTFPAAVPSGNSDSNLAPNQVLFNATGRAVATITNSADIISLQEWDVSSKNLPARPTDTNDSTNQFNLWHVTSGTTDRMSRIHFDGGNLLFTDGHVKWRKGASLKASDFGLTTGNGASTPGSPNDTQGSADSNYYSAAF